MNTQNKVLFEKAKKLSKAKQLSDEATAGFVGTVLVSKKGKIYSGISLSGACGVSFCGEVSVILQMIAKGETGIKKIVSVSNDGKCLPPCGCCRELMFQINRNNLKTELILGGGRVVKLKEIFPERWQELWQ